MSENIEKHTRSYLNLDFAKTMKCAVGFFIICFALTSATLEYAEIMPFPIEVVVYILKELSQLGVASIAVTAIINHTDLEKHYHKIEKHMTDLIDEIKVNYDYINHPESIPYENIENKNLDILFKKISEQRIIKLKDLKDLKDNDLYISYVRDMEETYFNELAQLEEGYLNKEFKRTVEVTPDSKNGVLHVKTFILSKMYIPFQENEKKRKFIYGPRFRTEEEAKSLQIITCNLNGYPVERDIRTEETSSNAFPYKCGKEVEFEYGQDNTFVLESIYDLDLNQVPEFQEVYRVSDPCCNYTLTCMIKGEEADLWGYDINNTEISYKKDGDRSCLEREEYNDGHSIKIKTRENRWIHRGTIFNLVIRKVKNNNV